MPSAPSQGSLAPLPRSARGIPTVAIHSAGKVAYMQHGNREHRCPHTKWCGGTCQPTLRSLLGQPRSGSPPIRPTGRDDLRSLWQNDLSGLPAWERPPTEGLHFLRLAWERALPAAVLEALPVLPSRRTLLAAFAALLLVCLVLRRAVCGSQFRPD